MLNAMLAGDVEVAGTTRKATWPVRNGCAESHAKPSWPCSKKGLPEQRWLSPPVTQAGDCTVRVT